MIQTLLMQASGPPSAGPPSAAPSAPATGGAPPSAAPTGTATGAPQPGAGGAGCAQGGIGNPIVLFPLLIVMMYFIMIRPEQKKRKDQDTWLKSLKKGDEVVTSGGVIGRISGMTDSTVTLEVQEKVRIKVLRSSVTGKAPGAAQPAPEPEKK
jgi:preprotein translocase subunit YajC